MAKGGLNRWLDTAQRKIGAWSQGRNGADELSSIAANVAIVLIIVSLFARTSWIVLAALVLLGYSWWRISSKDVVKRSRENEALVARLGPVAAWLVNPVAAAGEARKYKHLSCPSCAQRVRVPRGKGKVRIICPKCHTRFEGKA